MYKNMQLIRLLLGCLKRKFDFLKEYCQVVYLKRTLEIYTTKIKEDLLTK